MKDEMGDQTAVVWDEVHDAHRLFDVGRLRVNLARMERSLEEPARSRLADKGRILAEVEVSP